MAVAFSHSPAPSAASRGDDPLAHVHTLPDGTVVRLRALQPSDGDELRAGFARLSPRSRYLRFFSPVPRLPEPMLRRLLGMDGWNHVAIVAETIPLYDEPPEPLGVARFIRLANEPAKAEMAVTVIDELQGRGLGRLLVRALADLARSRGVAGLVAVVLAENVAMARLVRAAGRVVRAERDRDVVTYEVELA